MECILYHVHSFIDGFSIISERAFCQLIFGLKEKNSEVSMVKPTEDSGTENKCRKWLKAISLQSEFDWNLNQVNGADIIDL